MPFVITTKRPQSQIEPQITWHVSRVAVATLEEARQACIKIVQPYADAESKTVALGPVARICLSLMRKDWSGGTVGPLPDGTTIEVEAISWADLRESAGLDRDGFTLDTQTIAAFNAREAAAK